MASQEVSGADEQQLGELKVEYLKSPKFRESAIPFEEAYCLARIGRQPVEYDGPQRYCQNRVAKDGNRDRCRFHGAFAKPTLENLDKHAPLKHSMYALPETIRETLTDEEQDLLDWIMTWPEVYDIDLESDPAAGHSFDTLAIEIVRQARSSDYILANTEVTTEGVYDAKGELLETKEVSNRLIKDHQSQIRLIDTIKESLGITRKAQKKDEQVKDRTDVMDSLAGALGDLINNDESTYDPEMFE
ncbi:hypothetical protein [Halobellus limi]|uniref:Uncharacterized protein n=1 Tax=Halobellus limi TaxID=699433 RepID=A0A1H5ZGH7_9EURY|nr:hypothetical protein [Halobellus limi]QCC48099.1 hypothetical protein DV707_10745 [Halobellus limi]SEG35579.1 hypothetical protein SAMN04488133_1995 [Halobellus limi]